MKLIEKYFPSLSEEQKRQFEILAAACKDWNDKINVISRKDIENLETNHILHSLAIAKFIQFAPETQVIDLGTGGGFPGLPLAIVFPEVRFHLVDRVGKKLKVAEETAKSCGLKNVTFQHGDFGECKVMADYVVSRAVMPQPDLLKAVRKNIGKECRNAVPNGLISLKGGNLEAELKDLRSCSEVIDLDTYFEEEFFKTKKLVYTHL